MSSTQRTDTVSFTVKGQVVIPKWLRKDFEINQGTRAVVYKHNDHIVLKPLTAAAIKGARGLLKRSRARSRSGNGGLNTKRKKRLWKKRAMPGSVLDSFALIAYFRDEAGADKVETWLHKAARTHEPLHMTEVNYAEVQYHYYSQKRFAGMGGSGRSAGRPPDQISSCDSRTRRSRGAI